MNMWPKKKTAILVIHGAGSHQPFEACDKFVRGSYEELRQKNDNKTINIKHELRQRKGWVQNYISLSLPDQGPVTLDFYEYYWDIYMLHKVSLGDTISFLAKASQGAHRFYKRHPKLLPEATDVIFFRNRALRRKEREFGPAAYFKILGVFGTLVSVLALFPLFYRLIQFLAQSQVQIPFFSSIIGGLYRLIEKRAQDLMGDLPRYLSMDARSAHHETRQNIVNGAVEELRELMHSYDQIIIAGHSLGSVIAYDALNRIIHEANAKSGIEKPEITEADTKKIIGLVTFGSPLDKVAFCFWEPEDRPSKKGDPGPYVRRHVMAHFHGFRTRFLNDRQDIVKINDSRQFILQGTTWLNFYQKKDRVSGHLDFYDLTIDEAGNPGDGNIHIEGKFKRTADAHVCYWERENGMYKHIFDEFFQ